MVKNERLRLVKLPNLRLAGTRSGLNKANCPPPASKAATGIKVIPMMVMTVPVTTGGKNLTSCAKNGALRAG